MKAAIYARTACDMQNGGNGIEEQLTACRAFAEANGMAVVATYVDKAVSGLGMEREGLSELMRDSKAGAFDFVLAESLDRISRSLEDIMYLCHRLNIVTADG